MSTPSLRHILLAIDGSQGAEVAAIQAASLARLCGASLTILHVATPLVPHNAMSRVEARRLTAAAEQEGERLLAGARALAAGIEPCTTELHTGFPADVVCQRARELRVDLIVVGTRGLDAFDRFLLGSVSAAIAQRATCSVLIARHRPEVAAH